MFLNLLYKSLKADIMLRRVKAFVKRLLQVSAEQNASFACGALFLVSEVMKSKPGLKMLLQEDGVKFKMGWGVWWPSNGPGLIACHPLHSLKKKGGFKNGFLLIATISIFLIDEFDD